MEINKVYNCDCIEGLRLMEDESVDCCVTSPPYWGLRDYGTSHWSGGNPNCDHIKKYNSMQSDRSTLHGREPEQTVNDKRRKMNTQFSEVCGKCGAIRIDEQIGLEETPEQYVEKLVQVFHEVKRVLKKEGTLWLNLGDSYWGGGWRGSSLNEHSGNMQKCHKGTLCGDTMPNAKGNYKDIKNKDLVGIPWMVAFALRADGWYLRQDIIWHKPNPMPESVTDRCTKSHEYIFLLSRSNKYYYDAEAVMEKSVSSGPRGGNLLRDTRKGPNGGKERWKGERALNWSEKGRNKRSVWTIATKPYAESHFATFPEELITPCILAGCPKEGVVLDPFMGAGTTALVALRNRRNYIGYELNPEYCELIERRLEQNRVGWGQLGISDIFGEEQ